MYIKLVATKTSDESNKLEALTLRVIEARKEVGLSQEALGHRLGLERSGYGHYESGRQPFTIKMLFQLSRILGRPVEYFLGLDTGLTGREERVLMLFREAEKAGYGDVVIGAVHALVAQLLSSAGQVGQQVSDKP
jgi:transcriptional regulator with XRE-family HTH domain